MAHADAGGVVVSAGAFGQVDGRLELGFEDLGVHEVNDVRPQRIYRVIEQPGAGDPADAVDRALSAISDSTPIDWDELLSQAPTRRSDLVRIRSLASLVGALRGGTAEDGVGPGAIPEAGNEPALFVWGNLRVVEKLGEGGFGEIYRAYDPVLQREVALKLERAGAADGDARGGIEEARRLARIRHPNVLAVYGADVRNGQVGIWTDLLRGRTLEERLGAEGPLPVEQVALIGVDLCRALGAVHEAGLVHGDVKASNAMEDPRRGVVLVDFGSGRELRSALPKTGTPLALAPEVLQGEPMTPASDLYSLGVLLYRLCIGRHPVEAASLTELIAKHETASGGAASLPGRDLPLPIAGCIERALTTPGRRFGNAAEMERALGEVLRVLRPAEPVPSDLREDPAIASPGPSAARREDAPTQPAQKGERKSLTVVFVDVIGSTSLSRALGDETWHDVLDRFFTVLSDGIRRFGGTVNQYTGDGVMALFGAPIAHEDHAQRACHSALFLRDALADFSKHVRSEYGQSFETRIGMNSGEVVVGRLVNDPRMDYTARGEIVNLAAHMESLATPGTVRLTERTARLVEGYFALEDLGEQEVKGAAGPMRVYGLEGLGALRSRLDVSRSRGLSRFVGRKGEMATLNAALELSLEGRGRTIGVVGEAGVGKSRLCAEFVARCRSRGLALYEAHSLSHTRGLELGTVLELLRRWFGVEDSDSPETARGKIAKRVASPDSSLGELLPLVFEFLGVPDPLRPPPQLSPESARHQLVGFLRELVRRESAREPLILYLDDIHWIDEASDVFLAALVEAVPDCRAVLLLNFRPEYRAEWMARPDYQQLPLVGLTSQGADALLQVLLGPELTASELGVLIRERTGGNPFFVEEVVAALAESGQIEGRRGRYRLGVHLESVALPETVQSLLASRIDRLGEREKHVLQAAAVIGRTFSEELLARVAELPADQLGAALANLEAAGMLRETSLYPRREFVFKHPLTHATALDTQLSERRRTLHAATARALEALHAESLGEHAALIAKHWQDAGEALEGMRWHGRAARWCHGRDADGERRHWESIWELANAVEDPSEEARSLALAACTGLLSSGAGLSFHLWVDREQAEALFSRGSELAEKAGDLKSLVRLEVAHAKALVGVGDLEGADRAVEEAVSLADRIGEPVLRMLARDAAWMNALSRGDVRAQLELAEQNLSIASEHPKVSEDAEGSYLETASLAQKAVSLMFTIRLREGIPLLHEVFQRLEAVGALDAMRVWKVGLSYIYALLGDGDAALEQAQEAFDLGERLGGGAEPGAEMQGLAGAYLLRGDLDRAIEIYAEAKQLQDAGANAQNRSFVIAGLAEAHWQRGDHEIARSLASEALAMALEQDNVRIREWWMEINTLLATEGVQAEERIRAALREGIAFADRTGDTARRPWFHEAAAALEGALGNEAARVAELEAAYATYVVMGADARAQRLARELGKR